MNSNLGLVGVIAIVGIGVAAAMQYQSRVQLRQQNEALRQQVARMSDLSEDNQRLSNLVAQAKVTQASASERLQEVLKLRAEVTRLSQLNLESNQVNQAKLVETAGEQVRELAALRNELTGLSEEISNLRDDLAQGFSAAGPSPAEERTAAQANAGQDQPWSIRMITTHGDAFAEKLKHAAAAQDNESFQDVFGRYLQANGISLTSVAGLVYDERTGRVIVRGSPATLDAVERLTLTLDREQ